MQRMREAHSYLTAGAPASSCQLQQSIATVVTMIFADTAQTHLHLEGRASELIYGRTANDARSSNVEAEWQLARCDSRHHGMLGAEDDELGRAVVQAYHRIWQGSSQQHLR